MGNYSRPNTERDPPSRLRDLENGVCTCARGDALHLRHVQSCNLMGPYSHTKFERNSPSRLRDLENGVCTCARADALHVRHVQSSYLMGPYSALHMSEVECISTCARAHPVFQISQTAGRIAFSVWA